MEKLAGYFAGRRSSEVHEEAQPCSLDKVTKYQYIDLENATNKFTENNIIGRGEFGVLYKAVNRRQVLAVLKLHTGKKADKQLKGFAQAISKLDHRNLLKLEGYCLDKRANFLCYEYQGYQTLEERLIGVSNKKLKWQERLNIMKGICDGLQYLENFRSEVRIQIDLNVDKILLHEDMRTAVLTPKISEFGISRQYDEVPGYKTFIGWRQERENLSPEVNIYNFGIILMLMVAGRSKPSSNAFGNELIAEVTKHWNENTLEAWRDPFLSKDSQQEIEGCIELALRCTSPYAILKPKVDEIASTLANLGQQNKQETAGGYQKFRNLEQKLGHGQTSEGSGPIKVGHLREYRYDELESGTDSFARDRETGRGAFATVYQGEVDGKIIAVKKLQNDKYSEQFLNEVSILSALRHKNLVKLEGFCFHPQGTMLCYEYLPHGTLQDRLQSKNGKLSWKERYNILQGICKGLQYLHDECPDDVRIVHMDLKADNVLIHVDANGLLTPKIGDFGISFPLDSNKQYEYVEKPMGNMACTPPEYQEDGKISTGVDIYSFGLVMMETITGQPVTNSNKSSRYGRSTINKVENHMKTNDLKTLIDPSLGADYHEEIRGCIGIALDCIGDEETRPNISQISLRLSQIGQGNRGGKLQTTKNESISEELEKATPNSSLLSEHGKVPEEVSKQVMVPGSMLAGKEDGSMQDHQHEKSKTPAINSPSTAGCNYLGIEATLTNSSPQIPAETDPSDLDFTLDFDAVSDEPSDDEFDPSAAPANKEKEMEKALRKLHEALRVYFPHQIAESSGFIEEMVNKILANCTGTVPSGDLQTGLKDLVALSKEEDAVKTARNRAARKAEINEMKSRCSKLKVIMQEHAVEAKKLANRQAQLKNRKEILLAELEKIDLKLNDLPASIAEQKKMGIAAQSEGKRMVEQVRKEEAEIGGTSADDAVLAQLQKVQKGVCAQLEGILRKP